MTIRPATEADIPAIVELLKLSLGESLMPKSEAFWRWKHIDNPFGPSPVLLAFENEKLIGVRAFMRWEWQQGEKTIKSVRAVDTAVHPDFQGRGIFKKLTLELVDQCRQEGVQFIFNTPNASSMPGYLKMGWQKFGRMKISMWPVFSSFVEDGPSSLIYKGEGSMNRLPVPTTDLMTTRMSPEFLSWRYGLNPNIEYYQLQGEGGFGLFRIKKGRVSEMRLTELFWSGQHEGEIQQLLKNCARSFGALLITWSGIKLPMPALTLPVGPPITINVLNPDNSLSFGQWRPTLGDMEVF